MTVPKITSKPNEGHGLVPGLLSKLYGNRALGKPNEPIVTITVLEVAGHGEKDGNRHVNLSIATCEPIIDPEDVARLLALSQTRREARCPVSMPLAFPGWPDPEQRDFLVSAVREWGAKNELSTADINAAFIDYFGGPEHSNASDYRKASTTQLREFTGFKGIVDETVASDDLDDDDQADEATT